MHDYKAGPKKYIIISRILSIIIFSLGMAVFIGWLFDIELLKSLHPDFVSMKFNTAISFILAGMSVFIMSLSRTRPVYYILIIFISIIFLISILTIFQYLIGINMGIDELFFLEKQGAVMTYSPGRMALNTALSFIVISMAILSAILKKYHISQLLSIFLFLFSLLHIIGYIFKVPEVLRISIFTGMALHTAFGFGLLGLCTLILYAYKGHLAMVFEDTLGGYMARRILPFSIMTPIFLLIVILFIDNLPGITFRKYIHFISVIFITVFLSLSWHFLKTIQVLDKKQRFAESEAKDWQYLMNYIIQHDPNAIAVHDNNLNYVFVSNRYLKDYNVKRDDIIGRHHYEIFPEIPQKWRNVHKKALNGEILKSDEDFFIRQDGSIDYARWECRPWHKKDGKIGGIILYTEVITERKLIEKKYKETAEKLQLVLDHAGDGIFAVDKEGRAILVNNSALRILGYEKDEFLGEIVHYLHHHTRIDGTPYPREECAIYKAFADGCVNTVDTEVFWHKDKSCFPVEFVTTPIKDDKEIIGAVISFRDITERKIAEGKIIKALREKDNLLRELFHRTNNNMQAIQAMLLLQSKGHPDAKLEAFVELMNSRIDTMALVHHKLYATNDLSRIDLGEYLQDLSNLIKANHPEVFQRVELICDLSAIAVLFDTALPIGIVVHEILTNAVNHAFPEKRRGRIKISLKPSDAGFIEINVSDNGIGINRTIDINSLSTVGIPITFSIIKDQLKGSILLNKENGTSYNIRFQDQMYGERV